MEENKIIFTWIYSPKHYDIKKSMQWRTVRHPKTGKLFLRRYRVSDFGSERYIRSNSKIIGDQLNDNEKKILIIDTPEGEKRYESELIETDDDIRYENARELIDRAKKDGIGDYELLDEAKVGEESEDSYLVYNEFIKDGNKDVAKYINKVGCIDLGHYGPIYHLDQFGGDLDLALRFLVARNIDPLHKHDGGEIKGLTTFIDKRTNKEYDVSITYGNPITKRPGNKGGVEHILWDTKGKEWGHHNKLEFQNMTQLVNKFNELIEKGKVEFNDIEGDKDEKTYFFTAINTKNEKIKSWKCVLEKIGDTFYITTIHDASIDPNRKKLNQLPQHTIFDVEKSTKEIIYTDEFKVNPVFEEDADEFFIQKAFYIYKNDSIEEVWVDQKKQFYKSEGIVDKISGNQISASTNNDIFKGRASLPVGTIRNGWIKVAEGKWRMVKKGRNNNSSKEEEVKDSGVDLENNA
jgi:hypothetical protein